MPNVTAAISACWDSAAASFDDQVDHGLRQHPARAAWAHRMRSWMPTVPADVMDLGCGTGSLTLLVAEHGHRPVGIDLSAAMVKRARQKLATAGLHAPVLVGDASMLPIRTGARFDVILVRHLLWTLPDPIAALGRWTALLRPHGRLVLIEGRWDVPADAEPYIDEASSLPWLGGVTADRLTAIVGSLVSAVRVESLDDPDLWGRSIEDERYALIASL